MMSFDLNTSLRRTIRNGKNKLAAKAQALVVERLPVPRSASAIITFYLLNRLRQRRVIYAVIAISILWIAAIFYFSDHELRGYFNVTLFYVLWMPWLILMCFCGFKLLTVNKRDREDLPFRLKYIKETVAGSFKIADTGLENAKFHFATKDDAAITAFVNMKIYKGGIWETNYYDKYIRNKSHIQKNKFSIVLIKCQASDEYIGFTHILPVSAGVWEAYTKGKIADNNFQAGHLIASDPAGAEAAHGYILFSAGIGDIDGDYTGEPAEYLGYKMDLLEQCLAFHLRKLMQKSPVPRATVPVLFSNIDDIFYTVLEERAVNPLMISADDAPIFICEFQNIHEPGLFNFE